MSNSYYHFSVLSGVAVHRVQDFTPHGLTLHECRVYGPDGKLKKTIKAKPRKMYKILPDGSKRDIF